jgi:hypothetical protein
VDAHGAGQGGSPRVASSFALDKYPPGGTETEARGTGSERTARFPCFRMKTTLNIDGIVESIRPKACEALIGAIVKAQVFVTDLADSMPTKEWPD